MEGKERLQGLSTWVETPVDLKKRIPFLSNQQACSSEEPLHYTLCYVQSLGKQG